MWVLDKIAHFFYDLFAFFGKIAFECWDSFYIPNIIGDWLWDVGRACWDISDWFYHFSLQMDALVSQIGDTLTWSNIRSLILSWLPDLTKVITWWQNWTTWLGQKIDEWWLATKSTVQGWIDIATQGFDNLVVAWDNFWTTTFPYWTSKLDDLKAGWDNFWTVTFPTLVDFTWLGIWWDSRWKEIEELKDSWFKDYEPFWEGWQDWKDSVVEFFDDPLEWLLGKFTDWFLGPEG